MRFFFSLIALFALLFTLATATSTTHDDDKQARGTMSFFRPWTWTLPLPVMAEPNAATQHVRRHGPRRRAMHP
ncbi:hypothetical protein C8R44DRAFT_332709 [Mycena epipterygia]|nr:hypothetical protein C8R44DRAFT_332709 [Mycena epipterygia]